jgi:hypothetical protein
MEETLPDKGILEKMTREGKSDAFPTLSKDSNVKTIEKVGS